MKFLAAFCANLLLLSVVWAGELPSPVQDSDYRSATPAQAKLGQLLFYDRVLSGTYRVSCATCHNHDRASSNGFLLDPSKAPVNDELAVNGLPVYDAFKPSSRHAPVLFNLGAREFVTLFSDGRVSERTGGFASPAEKLPEGLRDVLAVQALFPAVTGDELVGDRVQSDLTRAAHVGNQAVWDALSERVGALPDYLPYFQAAFDDVETGSDIDIRHIANAISAFVATEWRSDRSPFDAFIRGNKEALTPGQKGGMELFYGRAGCDRCHSGPFQTDHGFHATGAPLWRFDADLTEGVGDVLRGRIAVTGKDEDLFRFRTPSLRNVAASAPYGHAGSYQELGDFLRSHASPVKSLGAFLDKHLDGKAMPDDVAEIEGQLVEQNEISGPPLSQDDVSALLNFLQSLTDQSGIDGKLGKPTEVPSSLVVD